MAEFAYRADLGQDSIKNIIAAQKLSKVPFTVSSTYRPGSITISGKLSHHARKNAVDSYSSAKNMQLLAAWIKRNFWPYTLELIHSGGPGYFVINGQIVSAARYGAAVVNQHYDHVHWAITNSGLKAGGVALVGGGNIVPIGQVGTPSANGGCVMPVLLFGGSVTAIGGAFSQLIF